VQRSPMRSARAKGRLAAPLAVLVCAASLALAPAAVADVGETIILRCTHGQSLAGFTTQDYNKALKELGADAEEYTGCAQQIRAAQLAAASGARGGPVASAPLVQIAASPGEQREIAHAANAGSAPLSVGSQVIRPGVVHVNVASALSSLPTPLLATLAFVLACIVAVLGGAIRKRVRARGSD
jgi:hypothetical protein